MKGMLNWLRGYKRKQTVMRSQQAVEKRMTEVIERVIFDIGAERLIEGTVRLEAGFRPRFNSSTYVPARNALALVRVGSLPEAAPLQALADEPFALKPHTAVLVAALVREFRSQSPRFRSLPEHA